MVVVNLINIILEFFVDFVGLFKLEKEVWGFSLEG